jgi:hypothetical protein
MHYIACPTAAARSPTDLILNFDDVVSAFATIQERSHNHARLAFNSRSWLSELVPPPIAHQDGTPSGNAMIDVRAK